MDAENTPQAPVLTGFIEERVALSHEEQAYDHGYHDGWEKRDSLPRMDEKVAAAYGRGYEGGYGKGFEAGVNFGITLQVQLVQQKAEPEPMKATTVVLPPPGTPLV